MSVLFVGPLPPPVHGFSAINSAMLAQLQQHGAHVSVFNRAPPLNAGTGLALRHWLQLVTRYVATVRHARTVYIGFSGGKGQLLDLPFFALAHWRRCKIYLHHHSFAYLSTYYRLTAWTLRSAGVAHHIVLGDRMGSILQQKYGVAPRNITVLSNSAFLAEANDATCTGNSSGLAPACPPIVGYL
jgi:hypothetical protein